MTDREFKQIVENSFSIAEILRKLQLPVREFYYKKIYQKISELKIETSHLGKKGKNGRPNNGYVCFNEYITRKNPLTHPMRIKILKENIKEHRCEICSNTEWLGEPITLELHHIDGDKKNNNLQNLQLVCPNCHSKTPNYKSKNKTPKQKKKYYCPRCKNEKSAQSKICKSCQCQDQCKFPRPSKETLENEINNYTFTELGRKYGVRDNTIRKLARKYGII